MDFFTKKDLRTTQIVVRTNQQTLNLQAWGKESGRWPTFVYTLQHEQPHAWALNFGEYGVAEETY